VRAWGTPSHQLVASGLLVSNPTVRAADLQEGLLTSSATLISEYFDEVAIRTIGVLRQIFPQCRYTAFKLLRNAFNSTMDRNDA
jgi:hypothetical protein